MTQSVQAEYLPAQEATRQHLVLLHGWGSTGEVWRPLLATLRPWADVTLLQLPGLHPLVDAPQQELEGLLAAILAAAPERGVYVGWSLGGQLACALASRAPTRVQALVTLCSNPCFVATGDWPGMESAALDQFRQGAAADPAGTLRRFDSLQTTGAVRQRDLLRDLQAQRAGTPRGDITLGLDWLASLDLREQMPLLAQPQLHLFGGRDALLPSNLPARLRELLAANPLAAVEELERCSHLAPLEAGAGLAVHIQAFLAARDLLQATEQAAAALDKRDVALSFSRAARDYDSVAGLQRDVGRALLETIETMPAQPADILDLGSGTGHFMPALQGRFPEACCYGLDLAEGMVRFARDAHGGDVGWLVGDAEALPLAAGSIDLIFSSLALQWCQRPAALFAELARVLRPGGRCVFSTLGPDTLRELRAAWAAVDEHQHVNTFIPLEQLHAAAAATPGLSLSLQVQPYRMQYQRVGELLNELKTLGAHNVNRSRPAGLTSRRMLQGMMQAYESWREQELLPATYEVYFCVLEKT